jgi:aspartate aminotransferase-like enzyme
MATANGIPMDRQEVPWGQGHDPADVRKALKTGAYDAVTMVWSETSTGALNHLKDVAAAVREFDDVLFLVDAVSALGAAPVAVDALGLDVCLAGTQKALAVPPGITVFTVSERALKRAATVERRGYYLDFLKFKNAADKDETPSTPATALIFALEKALERLLAEGLEPRYERHRRMARLCQDWAREHFALYTDERFLSPSVCCIAKTPGFDVPAYLGRVKAKGFSISNGYGKLKGETFRIGHFGEHTEEGVRALLDAMTGAIGKA